MTRKIAISLPDDLVATAKDAVRKRRVPSVSAYIARAMRQTKEADELDDMLERMLAETGGPLTVAEKRAAAAAFGEPKGTVARKRKRR